MSIILGTACQIPHTTVAYDDDATANVGTFGLYEMCTFYSCLCLLTLSLEHFLATWTMCLVGSLISVPNFSFSFFSTATTV